MSRLGSLSGRRRLHLANVGLSLLLTVGIAVLAWRVLPGAEIVRGGEAVFGLEPVLTVSGPGRGQYEGFLRPTAAAFGPDGEMHVVDAGNHRVVTLTPRGLLRHEFGGFGVTQPLAGPEPVWSAGMFNGPTGIDVDEAGTIYVADPRNNHVQVFDRNGSYLHRIPDEGVRVPRESVSGREGVEPMDVAVAGGFVYLADADRILVFSAAGDYVRQIGRAGSDSVHFGGVTGVAATDDGRLFVVDSGNGRVVALSGDGEKMWSVGGRPDDPPRLAESHTHVYRFGLPRSVTVMDDGRVVVLDSLDSTIVVFTPEGEFVARYGVRGGRPAEFSDPSGIDAKGDLLLVADTGNQRVQVVKPAR